MKLLSNRYGKARVRVMKILRDGDTHTIKEIDVTVLLTGDFGAAYTSSDNRKVVATDTIKNTVNVLAKQHLGSEIERFGVSLGDHFLQRYSQVETASAEILRRIGNACRSAADRTRIPSKPAAKRDDGRASSARAQRTRFNPACVIS